MPDIPISFTSSDKEIIASGTLHSFGSDNLVINLDNLKFVFEFLNDTGELRYEATFPSTTEARLRLFNFNSNLGTTLMFPYKVGTYRDRELYLNFTVYQVGQVSLKLLHYTFFLGSAV